MIYEDFKFAFGLAIFGFLCMLPISILTQRYLNKWEYAPDKDNSEARIDRIFDMSMLSTVILIPIVNFILILACQLVSSIFVSYQKFDIAFSSYGLIPLFVSFPIVWKFERYVVWPRVFLDGPKELIRSVANRRFAYTIFTYLILGGTPVYLMNAMYRESCGCGR